mgnify:CR=1 FL=1
MMKTKVTLLLTMLMAGQSAIAAPKPITEAERKKSAQIIPHTQSLLEMFRCNYLAPGWMSLEAYLIRAETIQMLKNRSCSGVNL